MTAPAAHRSVDIARWQRQELLLGAALPTALGVAGVVAAVTGLTTDPSTVERVVVGVLGLLFLAVGGGLLYWRLHAPPAAWLDIDGSGVTRRGRHGVEWQIPWSDVRSTALVRRRAGLTSYRDPRGVGLRLRLPRHALVVTLRRGAPRPPGTEGPEVAIGLGVPGRTAREVAAALQSSPRPPST